MKETKRDTQAKERKEKMLPLKLVRSLVLGETINNPSHILTQNHHHPHTHTHEEEEEEEEEEEGNEVEDHATSHETTRIIIRRRSKSKTPAILFLPTNEIIIDTYRLATIARDLGMDLYPTPSLSHIIFSNPSSSSTSTSSSSSSSSSSSTPSTFSFSSSSPSWCLPNAAVPIPFPSLSTAPLTHLRYFVNLSSRAFKLVFFDSSHHHRRAADGGDGRHWDCCSVSLYSRVAGHRIDSMDGFSRALAGKGWTFFKTMKNTSMDPRVYLFRKVDVNRVRVGRVNGVGGPDGACRVRELRLPHLDFGNAPLRILQYILLMTDDIFFLA